MWGRGTVAAAMLNVAASEKRVLPQFILFAECAEEFPNEKLFKLLALDGIESRDECGWTGFGGNLKS